MFIGSDLLILLLIILFTFSVVSFIDLKDSVDEKISDSESLSNCSSKLETLLEFLLSEPLLPESLSN